MDGGHNRAATTAFCVGEVTAFILVTRTPAATTLWTGGGLTERLELRTATAVDIDEYVPLRSWSSDLLSYCNPILTSFRRERYAPSFIVTSAGSSDGCQQSARGSGGLV